MTTRILFRFHHDDAACLQNLRLLRKLNPKTKIDGLYGGSSDIKKLSKKLTQHLDTLWKIPIDDPQYKWMHGDLCARWWFKDFGHKFKFDHLYFIEWDMLITKSLERAYGKLKKNCNYAPIFGDYKYAKKLGWTWIHYDYGWQTKLLLEQLTKSKRKVDLTKLSFGIMGSSVFCRKFLELYAKENPSSYSNDELRFAVWSKAFKIPLMDNGFWNKTRNRFNASNRAYGEKDINFVLEKGGSIIHPVRSVIKTLHDKII